MAILPYSQGNLIASNALTAVALADGLQAIRGVMVISFGSPCRFWPPGIRHHNFAFANDPVTWLDGGLVDIGDRRKTGAGLVAHRLEGYLQSFRDQVNKLLTLAG